MSEQCTCRDGLHTIIDYVDDMGMGDAAVLLLSYSALMRAIRQAADCQCHKPKEDKPDA